MSNQHLKPNPNKRIKTKSRIRINEKQKFITWGRINLKIKTRN